MTMSKLASVLVLSGCLMLPALRLHAKSVRASIDPVKDETPITDQDREHWAYRPLIMPTLPSVVHTDLVRTDIDRFVLSKLEAAQASLSPQADAGTLIRRITFDLIGLPPTPDEVQAFRTAFTANADAAYEALVDRLLESPHYGEKQAQQWLDLARFAETDGFEHDKERSESWQYRDWVINALNRDLPYDDFVSLQIAGDELAPKTDAIATGFLFAGPDMPDTNFQDERRHLLLNDITGTIGSALLGVTIGCAQCHDHPYDPVSQADFYRLRAFFDNLPPFKRDKQLGPRMAEQGTTVPISTVCIRGDHQRPGPIVKAAFPRIANPANIEPFPAEVPNSSGRRTALARWITQPSNGLFLRTTVNRLWQDHFGNGIAATSNDLGTEGAAPSHPELIDWLAAQLPRMGWRLKTMHKMIVMSATYRQASASSAQSSASVPDDSQNTLLAHFPRRRLSGEELRDAMLQACGLLNEKAGGPSVLLKLPDEVSSTLLKKQIAVTPDLTEHYRRSIYVFARRNLRLPMFDLFDRPDALLSCSRRNETVTATQALTMFNSEFSMSIARQLAANVLAQSKEPDAIASAATWNCLNREPSTDEMRLGVAFLQDESKIAGSQEQAVVDYCLALLNSNAFGFID